MVEKELTAVELYKVKELMAEVTTRALQDETFRNELIANPRATFEEFGVFFSEGRNIQVLENNDEIFYFVLPNVYKSLSGSDAQSYASMAGEGGNSSLDTGGPRCTRP